LIREDKIMTTTHRRIAVLGFGKMGGGIAQVVAQSGLNVIVLDIDAEALNRGRAATEAFLAGGVERGKLDAVERDNVLSRITGTTDTADLRGVDLVIEAATELSDVKRDLLAGVAAVVGEETIITTNTSALSVTDLGTAVPCPSRFAGLHFFNPAPVMKLVEVVDALQTSAQTLDTLTAFVKAIGKTAIVVKDRPGFLINSLLMPYLNDVIQEYDDGLASASDIDTAIKLGLGYKQGPFELLDLIGLDVHAHATRSAYNATLDPRFAPPPLLQQMVAAGRLGNKSGQGFRNSEEQS
jgi:3-hydroxybutyryl-CoA dehydrogenase